MDVEALRATGRCDDPHCLGQHVPRLKAHKVHHRRVGRDRAAVAHLLVRLVLEQPVGRSLVEARGCDEFARYMHAREVALERREAHGRRRHAGAAATTAGSAATVDLQLTRKSCATMAATTKPRGSPKRPRPVGATIDPAALAQVPALERVLAWASERGGVFDGLRLALDAHGGVGLYAARDFAPGDTLAFVPRACALTAATARESALGQRILAAAAEWGALAEATDELVLCVFLNWARAEPSCEWHPLVAAMPAQSPEPCCWPEPIRTELAGTPVGLAVSTAIARFALHAARLTTRLAAAGIIPEATASHEALLWARGMYHSRGYTGRLASLEAAAAPAGLPTPNGGADGLLLPIVDLMNHRHGQPITWQVRRARSIALLARPARVCFARFAALARAPTRLRDAPQGVPSAMSASGFEPPSPPTQRTPAGGTGRRALRRGRGRARGRGGVHKLRCAPQRGAHLLLRVCAARAGGGSCLPRTRRAARRRRGRRAARAR